ncbi:DUF192 domain-containing protein [Desulfosarcina sp.]|uniref:DUF192 domain-containing protein n=1 Tax=Desulfosarcina sp. TaxID=2027861 RepID=UPI0039707A9E
MSALLTERPIACPFDLPTLSVVINGHRLVVEVAATPQSRACGLSRRFALDENRGMLFVYAKADRRSFWMKDTWIPLSIAFLDDTGVIINMETMLPDQSEMRYRSNLPAVYVLEVNQGWFQSHGIKPGDRVEIRPPVVHGGSN